MYIFLKRHPNTSALLFLLIGLVLSIGAYRTSHVLITQEAEARLDRTAKQAKSLVEQRISSYVELLGTLQAQFYLEPYLSRSDFQNFYYAHVIQKELTCLEGIGYSAQVEPSRLDQHFERLQRELEIGPSGYPFSLERGANSSETSFIVTYIEPVEKNSHAVGKNQATDPARIKAIEFARDTGSLGISAQVPLLIGSRGIGIVFFMPLYYGGRVPETVEQRRDYFYGTVFAGVSIEHSLHDIFNSPIFSATQVKLYDVSPTSPSDKASDRTIFFDSTLYKDNQSDIALELEHSLQRTEILNVGGRQWQIELTPHSSILSQTKKWFPFLAGLAAFLLTAFAFFLIRFLGKDLLRAETRAKSAESWLESKEKQLELISDSIDQVLWAASVSPPKVHFVSPAVERIYGREAKEFYDKPKLWLECIHPDDAERVSQGIANIAATGKATSSYRIFRPDGEMRWVRERAQYTLSPNGEGVLTGIVTDITEQTLKNQALIRSNRALKASHACDKIIAFAKDERILMKSICDVLVASGYSIAWAVQQEKAASGWIFLGGASEKIFTFREFEEVLKGDSELDELIKEVWQSRVPMLISRESSEVLSPSWQEMAEKLDLHTQCFFPIFSKNQKFGLIAVGTKDEGAFDKEERGLLSRLVQGAAIAIESCRNLQEREIAEKSLHLRQRAIEALANPIAITNASTPERIVEYVNPAFEKVTGYTCEEICGASLMRLCDLEPEQSELAQLWGDSQQGEHRAVIRAFRNNGSMFWAEVYVAPVKDELDEITHFISVIYDITESKKYESELEYQSNYDLLTGIANRNLLKDRLEQAISYANSRNEQFWLFSIGIDRFKNINDAAGHYVGDAALVEIAQRLRDIAGSTDTAARMTGDEFMLIVSSARDQRHAIQKALEILGGIARPLDIEGREYFLTCSIGIAAYPADGKYCENLLRNAEIAMHRAKEAGSGNYQFYAPDMNATTAGRLKLESDLRHALVRNELILYYQPQIDLNSGLTVGFEALLRWNHSTQGVISPLVFIPIAEETGLIESMSMWVLQKAIEQCKAWHDEGHKDLVVSINLSASQFYHVGLAERVESILKQNNLDARYLDIELTESLVMNDVTEAVQIMHRLKDIGVKMSIDDFGTGYSSLSYLKRFPIDVLKIDQSFVRNITVDEDEAIIVRSIIGLAKNLRLEVIAEGVETKGQLEYLKQNGCEKAQGYYFSPPIPFDKTKDLLGKEQAELNSSSF